MTEAPRDLTVDEWVNLPVYFDPKDPLPYGIRSEGAQYFTMNGDKWHLCSIDGVWYRQVVL